MFRILWRFRKCDKKFFLRRSELLTWTSTHEVPCSSPRIPALSFSSDFPSSSSGLVMASHWAGSVLTNEKKKTKILGVKERNFYIGKQQVQGYVPKRSREFHGTQRLWSTHQVLLRKHCEGCCLPHRVAQWQIELVKVLYQECSGSNPVRSMRLNIL